LRTTAAILLLLALSSIIVVPVSAADVTITIQKEDIQTRMVLSLHQNITALPTQTSTITQSSSDSFTGFSQAIRARDPNATLTDLQINVASTPSVLNLTITMTLSGVAQRRGDVSTVDMAWKGFNVTADLHSGNLSYNLIGKKYFRPIYVFYANASKYVGRPNATITGISFLFNQTQSISPDQAIEIAGNRTLLNFKPLDVSLDQWTRSYNLSNDTTTWRYSPIPLLADSIRVQQGNNTKLLNAQYGYSAEIVASGLARANGNTLLVDVGSGVREWIMAAIVIIAIVSAVAVQILFRNMRKKSARMGRR
jgi:hypothetical protein